MWDSYSSTTVQFWYHPFISVPSVYSYTHKYRWRWPNSNGFFANVSNNSLAHLWSYYIHNNSNLSIHLSHQIHLWCCPPFLAILLKPVLLINVRGYLWSYWEVSINYGIWFSFRMDLIRPHTSGFLKKWRIREICSGD